MVLWGPKLSFLSKIRQYNVAPWGMRYQYNSMYLRAVTETS